MKPKDKILGFFELIIVFCVLFLMGLEEWYRERKYDP